MPRFTGAAIFARMLRIGAALGLAAISVAALAAGRGSADRDAAEAVQGVLAAAEAGDAARLESAIDRAALRQDLRRQLVAFARADGLEVDGGPSDIALDRRIGPEAVRLAAAEAGSPEDHLRKVGKTRICLTEAGPQGDCVLTFARERGRGAWRLVGMKARDPQIELSVDLGD